MGRIDICRSDSLSQRVEELILEAGGPTRAVLALMEHAAQRAPVPAEVDEGTRTVLVVRLTADEARVIKAAHTARGMSRAEWVRAVLRRQISDQRPLSRVDRGYLRRAMVQLQGLRQELARIRAAVAQASLQGRNVERPMRSISGLERKIVATAKAVHHGFLGDDSYWRTLDVNDE